MLKGKTGQIVLGALGGGLLLAGQVAILGSHYGLGGMLSAAGVLLALGAFILPSVPWDKAAGLMLELKAMLGSVLTAAKRKPAPALKAGAKPRKSQKLPDAAEPRGPWMPFANDTLVLSRHLLLIPIAVLALAGYMAAVVAGKTVSGGAAIVLLVMLMSVYLQDLESPFLLPNLNHNTKTLLKLLLGVPFQLGGVMLMWGYVHIYAGYFLVLVGSAIMLYFLLAAPLSLVEDGDESTPVFEEDPETPWWSPTRLAIKSSLWAGSALFAYLAMQVLAGRQPGLSVTCGFIAIGLLLLSFPWFPASLADWDILPALPRAALTVVLSGCAFFMGVHGQNLIEAGNMNGGLWYYLFAGIVLVLVLPRRHGEHSDESEPNGKPWILRSEILVVLLLFLAAIQFRAHDLETFPFGAEGDEAGGGVFAVEALKGKVDNALVTANVPLYYYSVTSVFFKIFGLSLAAMRAHAVIFGVLSVLSTYFFLRLFFGALVSYAVTALMSFSYWHLHYSRFGHYNIEQVMMQMTAFYFVFKGMKGGKSWHFLVGGLAFGFAMLPHLASRMLPFQALVLVAYFLVARRDLLRRFLPGFAIFVLASWAVAAPCLSYWFRATGASFGRASSVSIFDKTNTNAPVDVLAGFVHNSKISVMMFNDYSDSRTRNNPLAPQKILEYWTAILFGLSFIYVLYHWRHPLAVFLLAAFFINLAASIFSVEAPQTLRTAGNISIVFSMMGFLIYDVRSSFRMLDKKWGLALFAIILVSSTAFFSYKSWKKYFVEARMLAFDATPTYVAAIAGTRGTAADQAVFFAQGFAASHPPVLLFTQDTPIRNFFNVSDYLPVSLASDRKHILFFCDAFESITPWVQTLYPNAKPETIPHLTYPGQNLGTFFVVTKEEIASHLGLDASVDGHAAVKNAPLEYPSKEIPAARSIHWSGSVRFENYGLYTFAATGKGDIQLRLAGQLAYSRQGGAVHAPELRLPMGLLPIEADYRPQGGEPFKISWIGKPHPARMHYSFRATSSGFLDKRQLFDYTVKGFYGQYYVTKEFRGDSVMEYVEPTILARWLDSPFPGNWSAVWKARLKIPVTGAYKFNSSSAGGFFDIHVDGKLVHRSGAPPVAELHPPQVMPEIRLTAGEHSIEARFYTPGPSWYDIHWTQPGRPDELLQPEFLRPVYPHF